MIHPIDMDIYTCPTTDVSVVVRETGEGVLSVSVATGVGSSGPGLSDSTVSDDDGFGTRTHRMVEEAMSGHGCLSPAGCASAAMEKIHELVARLGSGVTSTR